MPDKPTIVLFLGAGFSRGISRKLPLTRDLYSRLCDGVLTIDRRCLKALLQVEQRVWKRCGRDIEQPFEEILREVWDNAQETFEGVAGWELYRILVNSVALITRYQHRGYARYADPTSALGKYLHLLREIDSIGRLTVITTNYDLINDKVVQFLNDEKLGFQGGSRPPKQLRRFQYGFRIRAVWTTRQEGGNHDREYNDVWIEDHNLIQIYKIHGSANWAYCMQCNEMDLSRVFSDVKKLYSLDYPQCPTCHTCYDYMIIPPLPDKSAFHNQQLGVVWHKGKEALKRALYVVFIGYSLPSADPLVLDWLKAGLDGNRNYFVMDTNNDVIVRYQQHFGVPRQTFQTGYSVEGLREIVRTIRKDC